MMLALAVPVGYRGWRMASLEVASWGVQWGAAGSGSFGESSEWCLRLRSSIRL